MRVLVLDADAARVRALRGALEADDLAVVESASSVQEHPVVVVFLPRLDEPGLAKVADIDARSPASQLIVVAEAAAEASRVQALRHGADDVVPSSISVAELAARVVAAVRRCRRANPPASPARFGEIVIEFDARTVSAGGEPVELTRREFDLLAYFVRHPGRTLSRQDLLTAVWDSSAEWQSETTVTEHVRRLRNKIEPQPSRPCWIVTVQGVGYRFDRRSPT